jgi:hypothetical protein
MSKILILSFSLFMLYISATTSYIKAISIAPKYSLRNLSLNNNMRLLKTKKLARLSMAGAAGAADAGAGSGTDGFLNNINKLMYVNANIIKNNKYYCVNNIPLTGEQINITSIYLNIDKVKGVYFAKDVKNVIFTLPENLSDLYYYDADTVNDGDNGTIYKISNRTRINLKNLDRFVFQRFNNNIDGILF